MFKVGSNDVGDDVSVDVFVGGDEGPRRQSVLPRAASVSRPFRASLVLRRRHSGQNGPSGGPEHPQHQGRGRGRVLEVGSKLQARRVIGVLTKKLGQLIVTRVPSSSSSSSQQKVRICGPKQKKSCQFCFQSDLSEKDFEINHNRPW